MSEILTIGHSNHPLERFLELLRQHHVEVLVDVRSRPFSRFVPHASKAPLERAVTAAGLRYLYLGDAVGGQPAAPTCYGPDGKVDYDLVEQHAPYQAGVARLHAGAARYRICLLCAEEDPARCHRRLLITRTLVREGADVHHIRGSGALVPEAELRAAAAATAAEPARQLSLLDLTRS